VTDNYENETDQGELVAKQQGQLVPVEPNVAMDMMAAALGSGSAIELSNFDGDANRKWELSSMATSGDAVNSEESAGEEIAVKYIYMHGVTVAGQTDGEVMDAVRTVLITDDLKCYSFVSSGVALEAFKMLRAFKCQPFSPPRVVRVVRKTSARKRKFLTLVAVPSK
jgi:hypothetical protein